MKSLAIAAAIIGHLATPATEPAQEQYGRFEVCGNVLDLDGTPLTSTALATIRWRSPLGRDRVARREFQPDANGDYEVVWVDNFSDMPVGRVEVTIWRDPTVRVHRDKVFATALDGAAAQDSVVVNHTYTPVDAKVKKVLDDVSMSLPPSIGTLSVTSNSATVGALVSGSSNGHVSSRYRGPGTDFDASISASGTQEFFSWSSAARFKVEFTCPAWSALKCHTATLLRGQTLSLDTANCPLARIQLATPSLITADTAFCLWPAADYPGPPVTTHADPLDSVLFYDRQRNAPYKSSLSSSTIADGCEWALPATGDYVLEVYSGYKLSDLQRNVTITVSSGGPTTHQVL